MVSGFQEDATGSVSMIMGSFAGATSSPLRGLEGVLFRDLGLWGLSILLWVPLR